MKTGRMKFTSALLVSHITDLAGPSEALENYLRARSETLGVIYHPFGYCSDRRSSMKEYRNGALVREKRLCGLALPSIPTYVKDAALTLWFFLRLGRRFETCVAADPLNAFVAVVLKKLGLIKHVSFYTIDWMPERFSNRLLNGVYHALDRFCARNCDAAWNISPRIVDIRRSQGLPDAKNVLVPVGVDLDKINLPDKTGLAPKKLVLLGALAPSKGVDLVIEAWPSLLARFPGLELHVIGKTPHNAVEDGVVYQPYEGRLAALGPSVVLHGRMDHDAVLRLLPGCDISLALYKPSPTNLSQWADPSRVKDYLACGLPVVITDVPEIAKDVKRVNAGKVCEYTVEDMARAVGEILADPEGYLAMRRNAVDYMKTYEWAAIFDASFEKGLGGGAA